ncbi:adenylate/guanylate cyclase domain-containing protein, partial [Betaproteobacteria bacterium PRO7]|nr:adenylate/guanylate cyclase domain-containing protein [Betaproteobacteria bacterium PRO7]
MTEPVAVTYLFTDIEGSTRLWEEAPERMRLALARHDALCHAAVERHRGTIVKTTGDGVHAAFDSAHDALAAAVDMQLALAAPEAGDGIVLRIRCGLHRGVDERRAGDFYGREVNRAARIMSAAHGGQILVSQAVADAVRTDPPADVSLRDLGAVRLRDLAAPERVYQVIHPRLRAEFPALRSLDATPNNLAQQLNSFVGRSRELADVRRLLAANRLVTLLGMGGIGKSRLSVQLGAEVLDDYPDGVWLIELAPLADAQLVPQAVAAVLGVKEEAGGTVLDALLKFARDRTLLIILDNCEHLVHACADVAKRLLQAGPKVKILATSRDALQIAGETVFQLAPLAAPDPRAQAAAEALAQSDAVRLFVDRAGAAQPAFRLTANNARTVAAICHQLDGIPLALELAAARTRALSVEAIAARLHERFKLLVTGDRTVLPRQRTLRALIDWSYDLLAPPERTLFQRLSIFAGGWTLEAAEAVGAGGDIEAADVLDLLARLVEKSLVIADIEGGRYRMLETVRQYALERLREAGDEETARTRHLEYYLALAERALSELAGPLQGQWLARLDCERDNLLAAIGWSAQADDRASSGLRLVYALRPYWLNRGLLMLGCQVTVEVLAWPALQQRDIQRCRALFGAGQLCFFSGRDREARIHLTESLDIARALGRSDMIARVLQPLGMACLSEHDFDTARTHLEEALALAREQGNPRELAGALNSVAMLRRMEGALAEAESMYRQTVEAARAIGDQESIAIGLLNLAMVQVLSGRNDEAAPNLVEADAIGRQIGSQPVERSFLEACAGVAAARGDFERAVLYFGSAEMQREQTGLRR